MSKLSKIKSALDMSKAARMARAEEQGFDVDNPIYHTTDAGEFQSFRFNKLGSNTARNTDSIWAQNLAKLGAWHHERPLQKEMGGARVMENYLSGDAYALPSLEILEHNIRQAGGPQKYRRKLLEDGYSAVTVKDEEFGGISTVVLDMPKVRSVNAAFDPANIGKNDLLGKVDPRLLAPLAAGSGAAVAAQNIYGDDEKTQRAYNEFRQRRASKDAMWRKIRQGGEAIRTIGQGMAAGLVSDAYRLGGYLSPQSVQDTEAQAQTLQNRLSYVPEKENQVLNYLDRELDQFGYDVQPIVNAWQQTPVYKGYKMLPERVQGVVNVLSDYAL